MAKTYSFLISLLFVDSLYLTFGDFTCTVPPPRPNDPPFPALPSGSYQAYVEVNVVDRNYTMDIEEYYEGSQGLMKITRGEETIKMIYSYDTDELFYIKDKQCTVKNLTEDNMLYLHEFGNIDEDFRQILGSITFLKYDKDTQKVFEGLSQVRGISSQMWTTCTKWRNAAGLVKVTYYLNTLNWRPAMTKTQIPLRIEVEGETQTNGTMGDTSHHFHHVFDFIDYVPNVQTDRSVFETPTDVVCVGRLKTKPLPSLGPKFQYRAEVVDTANRFITHYAVWYDEEVGLVREDTVYREPSAPTYTTGPVSEIHDFRTGLRYIRDQILGNCSVWPISLTEGDSQKSPDIFNNSQSFVIDLKDPHKFFKINDNYTYTGQREVRGIKCDVYSAHFAHFQLDQIDTDASFHYFFVADEWIDVTDTRSRNAERRYPVQLEIRSLRLSIFNVYNFFDFDDQQTTREPFDVSDCFANNNKLGIKMTFPGTYFPSTEKNWMNSLYFGLANVMEIPPIRIAKISIKSDSKNVYVKAVLLGNTFTDQFQLVSHTVMEHADDKVYMGIGSSEECAKLCIHNSDFVCHGYDYCSDDKNACHLSRFHVQDNQISHGATICDHYSRTVASSIKQHTLSEAYTSLQNAIADKTFFLSIQNTDGFIAVFAPIEVEITSGFLSSTKILPSLPSQFSYRMETVIPALRRAADSYVWYDSTLNLVRLDSRNLEQYPYFETSRIHDFTSGVSFNINKVTGECSLSPIPNNDAFDVDSVASKASKDAGLLVKMKSPLQLLYLDWSYQYIGQESVRGILCDVFQSTRTDFHISLFNKTIESSIFTFYFQADDWSYYTAESIDTTLSQPLQLKIEDTEVNQVLLYHFFDYNDEHHSLDYYDTSACFEPDQKKRLLITFKNQPYHPVLDATSPSFINDAIQKLADSAGISPIRLQRAELSHDDVNIYLSVTLLGSVSPSVLFTPVHKVTMDTMTTSNQIQNLDDCARACLQTSGSPCLSFDFCPNEKPPSCHPEASRGLNPSYGRLNETGQCVHYSLTDNGFNLILDVDSIYWSIKGGVDRQQIKISISLPDGTAKTFTATNIRDGLYRTGESTRTDSAEKTTAPSVEKGTTKHPKAEDTRSPSPEGRITGQPKELECTTKVKRSVDGPLKTNSADGSSDTGVKIGIGLGAFFIGMLIGSLAIFMYFKHKAAHIASDDNHPLKSFS